MEAVFENVRGVKQVTACWLCRRHARDGELRHRQHRAYPPCRGDPHR
ncbi:hypothetical protein AB5I41_21475 [Sphingomonas sp. MMS24-JH45]